MKTTTITILGVATAFLVTSCVMFEDRIARVTTPEIAAAAITASCTGGLEFITAATATLDQTAAAILSKGVETACALRAQRNPISATIYDVPLDQFCAETVPLASDETDARTRHAFNTHYDQICGARE